MLDMLCIESKKHWIKNLCTNIWTCYVMYLLFSYWIK